MNQERRDDAHARMLVAEDEQPVNRRVKELRRECTDRT